MGHVKHLIIRYVDGELSAAQEKRVRTHLTACPACREALDQQTRVSSDLKLALRYLPAPGPARTDVWWRAIRQPTPRRRTVVFVPVLMCLAFLLLSMIGPHQQVYARPVSTTVAAAAPALNTTLYPPSPAGDGVLPSDASMTPAEEDAGDSLTEAPTPAPERRSPDYAEPIVSPVPPPAQTAKTR
jgi:anti-sigma factor RsiW